MLFNNEKCCSTKDTLKKVKSKYEAGRKYSGHILKSDLYLDYIKNSQEIKKDNPPNAKMGKSFGQTLLTHTHTHTHTIYKQPIDTLENGQHC